MLFNRPPNWKQKEVLIFGDGNRCGRAGGKFLQIISGAGRNYKVI